MIKHVSMGAYEINTPGKAEFQGFGSQEELDAAIKLGGLKEDNNNLSLEEKSQKAAKDLAKITRSLGGAGSEQLASEVAGKNTPKTVDKVLTKTLDANKKKTEKTKDSSENKIDNKESLDIGKWEKEGVKEITQIEDVLQNIDSLQGKTSKEVRNTIDFVDDEITLRNKSIESGIVITREGENLVEDMLDNERISKLNSEITELKEQLILLRKGYINLDGKNTNLSDIEIGKYAEIETGDFLRTVNRRERLKFVTQEGISGEDLSITEIKDLTITFTYGGVLNADLKSQLTAGQVLPKEVSSVEVGGKKFKRQGLLGEFVSGKERLKIVEGTELKSITYRGNDELEALEKVDNYEGNIIKQEAAKRNIDPELFEDILKEALNKIDDSAYQKAALEQELANFDRLRSSYGVLGDNITVESVKNNHLHRKVIAGLFNGVYSQGEGWYGIREFGKNENNYINNSTSRLSYLKNTYGISSEIVGESALGNRIVSHLKQRNFRPYTNRASNCGRNCGEALLDMGIPDLPKSGRHGYKWAGFLENHSMFSELSCYVKDAPPGSVISYHHHTGGSPARTKYGHVEIALGGNQYWFGKKLSRPGGSDKNPTRGEYRVFAPVGSVVETKGNDETLHKYPKGGIEFINELEKIKDTDTYKEINKLIEKTTQKMGDGSIDKMKLFSELSKEWFGVLKDLSKKEKNHKDLEKLFGVSSKSKEAFNNFMKELKDGKITEAKFDKEFDSFIKLNVEEEDYSSDSDSQRKYLGKSKMIAGI